MLYNLYFLIHIVFGLATKFAEIIYHGKQTINKRGLPHPTFKGGYVRGLQKPKLLSRSQSQPQFASPNRLSCLKFVKGDSLQPDNEFYRSNSSIQRTGVRGSLEICHLSRAFLGLVSGGNEVYRQDVIVIFRSTQDLPVLFLTQGGLVGRWNSLDQEMYVGCRRRLNKLI